MAEEEKVEEKELTLSTLSPAKGSRHRRRRVARGESSGWGKTAGRGNKGQTSRSGKTIPAYFEGGQMPLYRRIGKIGFRSPQQFMGLNRYAIVPVSALEPLDNGTEVTTELLVALGVKLPPKKGAGIKILGDGELTKKLTVKVQAVTKSAKEKIEKAGGTVDLQPLREEASSEAAAE